MPACTSSGVKICVEAGRRSWFWAWRVVLNSRQLGARAFDWTRRLTLRASGAIAIMLLT